jgi:hypothetical protein
MVLMRAGTTVSVFLVLDLGQHNKASLPFNERRYRGVVAANYEIAFPVSGHRPIFNVGRSLPDRDRSQWHGSNRLLCRSAEEG